MPGQVLAVMCGPGLILFDLALFFTELLEQEKIEIYVMGLCLPGKDLVGIVVSKFQGTRWCRTNGHAR